MLHATAPARAVNSHALCTASHVVGSPQVTRFGRTRNAASRGTSLGTRFSGIRGGRRRAATAGKARRRTSSRAAGIAVHRQRRKTNTSDACQRGSACGRAPTPTPDWNERPSPSEPRAKRVSCSLRRGDDAKTLRGRARSRDNTTREEQSAPRKASHFLFQCSLLGRQGLTRNLRHQRRNGARTERARPDAAHKGAEADRRTRLRGSGVAHRRRAGGNERKRRDSERTSSVLVARMRTRPVYGLDAPLDGVGL